MKSFTQFPNFQRTSKIVVVMSAIELLYKMKQIACLIWSFCQINLYYLIYLIVNRTIKQTPNCHFHNHCEKKVIKVCNLFHSVKSFTQFPNFQRTELRYSWLYLPLSFYNRIQQVSCLIWSFCQISLYN